MLTRILLLLTTCTSLTSCGTATHLLGQAGGLVNSFTSPVLGAIRLSDSPDLSISPAAPSAPAHHDSRPASAKRSN